MEEQEIEAVDAIAKWQQSGTASEEKCSELEEKLKKALDCKESIDDTNDSSKFEYVQLKEDNASLQQKIEYLETNLARKSDNQIDLETQQKDTVVELQELQEALKAAQETLTRDEEAVQQWEGE